MIEFDETTEKENEEEEENNDQVTDEEALEYGFNRVFRMRISAAISAIHWLHDNNITNFHDLQFMVTQNPAIFKDPKYFTSNVARKEENAKN